MNGQKKDSEQVGQDTNDIMHSELGATMRYLAVYDGHGQKGKEASQYAKDELKKQLINDKATVSKFKERKDAERYFRKIYNTVQNKFKKKSSEFDSSGTCSISVLIVDNHCFIVNLGDSRAVIGSKQGTQKIAYQMSIDHKANREDEKKRIESGGTGIVVSDRNGGLGPYRVYSKNDDGPGLAVSRSLGDLFGHQCGIASEPEVSYKELDGDDIFVVIGSDGIWDVMNSAEVVGFVYEKLEIISRENIPEFLVKECRNRWELINSYKEKLYAEKNTNKEDKGTAARSIQQIKQNIDDITAVICFFSID